MNKERWIRIFRVLLYGLTGTGTIVGASLIKNGGLSAAYADGTYVAKTQNGEVIFFTSLIILVVNILWGILRWFLRGQQEKWSAKQIIGKLIGGGVWRVLAFILLGVLALFVVTPKISELISKNVLEQILEPISLHENYDRLKYIDEHFNELDFSEIQDEIKELLFNRISFGTDASNNIATKKVDFRNLPSANAYSNTVTTLNKARLSANGNFVIFYTDVGDDKISDEEATKLAKMLEDIIVGYKSNLGFDYKYEYYANNGLSAINMAAVLYANNIDVDILNTAMPVYVVNPYKNGSSTLASYAGRRFKELGANILIKIGALFGEETAALYNTTPSYPFINILPTNVSSESLAIVTAHELGHHYAANYNYDHFGDIGSDDDFVDETGPNWMAINVLKNQPIDNLINQNHYNYSYLYKSTYLPIDQVASGFLGYPAVAFLENYYDVAPNSRDVIMQAIHNGDALRYLYQAAGEENFTDAMNSLAEKNLTGDYNGKLVNTILPHGDTLRCIDVCSKQFYALPASTDYVYFATTEYQNDKIIFESESKNIHGSLVGKKLDGSWEVIESKQYNIELKIGVTNILNDYEVLAFAISNSSLDDSGNYKISSVAEEIENIIATAGKFDFSKMWQGLENGCFEINTDSLLDNFINLLDFGHDFIDVLELYTSENMSGLRNYYDSSTSEIKGSVAEAKAELTKYRISICADYINPNYDFDTLKVRLEKAMGYSINIYDEFDGDDRISVFIGFDLLARTGKVYALLMIDEEIGLVTINVAEK